MITPPPTWARHGGANVLTLVPPEGQARIRYHERLAARRFADLVEDLLAGDAGFAAHVRGPIERLTTEEGEHAAWIELGGRLVGRNAAGAARRWIGAVLLDDFAAAIDGVSRAPALDERLRRTTRWLLVNASFGLGARRRRFFYPSPPGWLGVPSGLSTIWYAPAFPRRPSMITVFAAEPSRDTVDDAFAEILDDEARRAFVRSGSVEGAAFATRGPLAGKRFRYHGRWPTEPAVLERQVIVLSDGRYLYLLRLDAPAGPEADAEGDVLAAIAIGAEPLPPAGRGSRFGAAALAPDVATPWSD